MRNTILNLFKKSYKSFYNLFIKFIPKKISIINTNEVIN